MASDRTRASQHAPKIILGVLLSRTLDMEIAHLVLIFNLSLVLHASPPKKNKKRVFYYAHFETTFLLLSKLVLSLASWKWYCNVFFFMTSSCARIYSVNLINFFPTNFVRRFMFLRPFGLVLLVRYVCNSIFQYEAFKLKHKAIQSITFRSKIYKSFNYPS